MQSNTSNLPKNLQDENLFVDQIRGHFNYVCQQMSQTDDRISQLDKDSLDFYFQLQRVQNAVSALKNKRYVQELIVDEDEDRRSARYSEPKTANSDVELRDSIVEATQQGLQLISQKFKAIAIQIPNQFMNEQLIPNDIYEAIDCNLIRDLPPIIGSSHFNTWNVSDVMDRPTETNEIMIGRAPSQPQLIEQSKSSQLIEQPKPPQLIEQPRPPQLIEQPKPSQPILEPSPISIAEDEYVSPVVSTSKEQMIEPAGSTPKNEFLTQLNERLASENLAKQLKQPSLEPTTRIIEQPVPQQRKLKAEEPPKQISKPLIDDSSSDESLFKAPTPAPQKPAPQIREIEAKPTPIPQKPATEPQVREIEAKTETVKALTNKAPKKSLLDDSDDSFDELFKPSKNLLPTKTVPSTATAQSEQNQASSKMSSKLAEDQGIKSNPVSKPVSIIKRAEPKKRSIFDSSSSSDEGPPTKEPTKVPVDSEEEMPKNVLNSVSGDFSNRLNQALLKRPSPKSVVTKPDENVNSKSASTPSTSLKREPVESRKQESVAALRGKIGDSIARAHRIPADSSKTLISSSDEADVQETKVKDQGLIQTLKARPRPARAPRSSRPPVPQVEENIEDKPKEDAKGVTVKEKEVTVKEKEATVKEKLAKPRKGLFDSSDSDDPF